MCYSLHIATNHPGDPAFYSEVEESGRPTIEGVPAPHLVSILGAAFCNTREGRAWFPLAKSCGPAWLSKWKNKMGTPSGIQVAVPPVTGGNPFCHVHFVTREENLRALFA